MFLEMIFQKRISVNETYDYGIVSVKSMFY